MEELCEGNKHIACCSNKEQPDCIKNPRENEHDKGKALYPMNNKFIEMILDKHNQLRSSVACGECRYVSDAGERIPVPDFMNEIVWSWELAGLAEILIRNCIYGHSKCHNSPNFRYSGQNLGIGSSSKDNREFAMGVIQRWFNEYQFMPNITDLRKYVGKANPPEKSIGHFTALIRADQTHVGCAMVKCRSDKSTTIFACNYSETNMIGSPTYEYTDGNTQAGQKCNEPSENFECLCKA